MKTGKGMERITSMSDREKAIYAVGYMIVKNNKDLSFMSSNERAKWIFGFMNGVLFSENFFKKEVDLSEYQKNAD
jgi:hypothetical protein